MKEPRRPKLRKPVGRVRGSFEVLGVGGDTKIADQGRVSPQAPGAAQVDQEEMPMPEILSAQGQRGQELSPR